MGLVTNNRMKCFRFLLLAALVSVSLGWRAPVLAQTELAQTSVVNEYTVSEIIPEAVGFAPGETLWFAVRQELRHKWHVFWVNPGDAGLPLALDWGLPAGFEPGAIIHPTPEYIPVGPLASYAHEGEPVFLIPVRAPADAPVGETIRVSIDASWQACEEICVPEDGRFSFELPVTQTLEKDESVAALFARARAAQPFPFDGEASFSVVGDGYELRLTPPNDFADSDVFFFAEPEGLIKPAGAQVASMEEGELVVTATPGWVDRFSEETLNGVLTFRDASGEYRGASLSTAISKPITKPTPFENPQVDHGAANIPVLLALAFFGGVLLNIMPCVFPIVFVKAASFMQSAREHPARVRAHGLLYTAGVLATFLLIGGLLLVLRAGGEQFGWGFHLQSPLVVALSAYVLFLVGLNLAGVFEVGERLTGAGDALTRKGGGVGAFFTGTLAVVVAAPCIGPLLSAPMGAALLLPPIAGMAIFAMLALGLAAPYLALSFAPGLGARLPKPGAWMATFKQALSFPVFAAAAYFLWVLAQQASGAGLAVVLAGAVLLAFAAWSFERSKGEGARALVLRVLSALAVVAAVTSLTRIEPAKATFKQASGERETYAAMQAEAFDPDAIERYRNEGVPVFVDFTAAWCVTCQFNKLTVFSDASLATVFDEAGAVFMVADWTVRDPEITDALASFGASGVPLYVAYAADGSAKVLSLPLTKNAVVDAISPKRPIGDLGADL